MGNPLCVTSHTVDPRSQALLAVIKDAYDNNAYNAAGDALRAFADSCDAASAGNVAEAIKIAYDNNAYNAAGDALRAFADSCDAASAGNVAEAIKIAYDNNAYNAAGDALRAFAERCGVLAPQSVAFAIGAAYDNNAYDAAGDAARLFSRPSEVRSGAIFILGGIQTRSQAKPEGILEKLMKMDWSIPF
ncbi:MAG: hypothetical protein HY466_03125 [Deltaproteobacteria bacterium]|nr:hypothetical protein [Deltaproteobacteria bacterium]